MDNNNNKKKTCDYENQKKIIMKILPLPCPYRENWTQSDTTYFFNASSQITNSFISIHNFFNPKPDGTKNTYPKSPVLLIENLLFF